MEANEEEIVYQRGLLILSHRDHSTGELRRKLMKRGFPAAAIRAALSRLIRAELLDDLRFSQAFVRERMKRRPMGRQGLLHELLKRGVDEDAAKEAIAFVMEEEGTDEVELARRALRGGRNRTVKSIQNLLRRRGFDSEVIRIIMSSGDMEHDQR